MSFDLIVIGGGPAGYLAAERAGHAGLSTLLIEKRFIGGVCLNEGCIPSKALLYSAKVCDQARHGQKYGVIAGSVLLDHEAVVNRKNKVVNTLVSGVRSKLKKNRVTLVEGLGLERVGVETERGRIKTDERGKTNIPEIYAAGDVNGVSMLAHTAYREAEVCISNMLGKKDIMRYNAIPSVIYTNPEVGCVGETEESAKQNGIEFETAKLSMMYSGRYVAENEDLDGICKVLIDKRHRRIIGVHMIGSYASEMIYGAGMMIETEMRVEDVKKLVFPHPTVSEIIRETIFEL